MTKPGGSVGLNEVLWLGEEPPADMVVKARNMVGPYIESATAWRPVWEASGPRARTISLSPVDVRVEVKSRVQCGWPWFLRAEARAARLYATDPVARRALNAELTMPHKLLAYAGYGLFAGMK